VNPAESGLILWNFKGEELIVKDHALTRFIERWPKYSGITLREPVKVMKRLFFAAHSEDVGILFRAYRLIGARKPIIADYYRYERWRFVVIRDGGERLLVTAELDNWGNLSKF